MDDLQERKEEKWTDLNLKMTKIMIIDMKEYNYASKNLSN